MDNIIVWLIIISFYTPLHFGLPVLVLVLSGDDSFVEQKPKIKSSLLDSLISLVIAFSVAILLVVNDYMTWAMLCLLIAIAFPVIRIFIRR
ncbi:MAG: hypothetical protein HKP09_03670 [Enterobacterales bacterium]|nr:hypothetical protein [Enterobacterales bacterium]